MKPMPALAEPGPELNGRRERTKIVNRQAILAAARRTFAELGFDAASVRDIIRRTDLASGTFYNYFRSKEEVFEALADDGARRLRPILRAAREEARSFEEYLRAALTAYFEFLVAENPEGEIKTAERRPHVRNDTPEIVAVYDEVRQGLESIIARGLAPAQDCDFLSHGCIGAAQEIGAAMLDRSPRDVPGAVEFASRFILKGVAGAHA